MVINFFEHAPLWVLKGESKAECAVSSGEPHKFASFMPIIRHHPCNGDVGLISNKSIRTISALELSSHNLDRGHVSSSS